MKKRGEESSFLAPASIPRRILAFVIDILIIRFTIMIPFNSLLKKAISGNTIQEQLAFLQSSPETASFVSMIALLVSIIVVLYFSYFEYNIHQTPGKILTKIESIPEKKNLTLKHYILSNLTFIAIFPFTLLWIIDPIYVLISPKNQRLMEKFANIIVIQRYYYR